MLIARLKIRPWWEEASPSPVRAPEGRLSGEDGADGAVIAVGRVGGGGPMLEVREGGAGLGQLGDACLDLAEVLVDEVGDVPAWRLAGVADGQDAADLGEGESGRLGVADEGEPRQRIGRIVAVARVGARRGGSSPACS
jgi:hypothetical protein